jgi:hypothetical protein
LDIIFDFSEEGLPINGEQIYMQELYLLYCVHKLVIAVDTTQYGAISYAAVGYIGSESESVLIDMPETVRFTC